jgi:tetratricopeptide (TPR) repeat protein
MAPEQWLGLQVADTRSDIFSLGAVIFEMVTGKQLFGEQDSLAMADRRARLPLAHEVSGDVPATLSDVISRCVAYEAQDRYQSFAELKLALAPVRELLAADRSKEPQPTSEPVAVWGSTAQFTGEIFSLISLGRCEDAVERADVAIGAEPAIASHWLNKGKALGELKRFAEAKEAFGRAVELEPCNSLAWSNLAFAENELRNLEDGLAAAARAIALDGNSADAWHARGCIERQLVAHDAAIVSLRRAADLALQDYRPHANLGFLLSDLGRYRDAVTPLETAARLNPNIPLVFYHLGVCYAALNNLDEAEGALQRSLRLDPRSSATWVLRGLLTWWQTSNANSARAEINRALELDPHDQSAHAALRLIAGDGATGTAR